MKSKFILLFLFLSVFLKAGEESKNNFSKEIMNPFQQKTLNQFLFETKYKQQLFADIKTQQTKSDPGITLFELDGSIHTFVPYVNQNVIWYNESHSSTYPVSACCFQEDNNLSSCIWHGIESCNSNPELFNLSLGQGSKILYLWIRDLAYNVSDPATISLVYDSHPPNIATFSGPFTTYDRTIDISFVAADVTSYVTGFMIKENDNTTPTLEDPGWVGNAPNSFMLSALPGQRTLYAWAKDAAGNIGGPQSYNVFYDAYDPAIVPQSFSYQAVARDNSGNPLTNQSVSFRISIIKETAAGENVYSETHTVTSKDFVLATLSIGAGTILSGTFEDIEWGRFDHFLKTEMDETGGSNFQLMGTSQLLSVPYAFTSGNAKEHLNHLKDVDTTNLQPGTILQWNGNYWEGVDLENMIEEVLKNEEK